MKPFIHSICSPPRANGSCALCRVRTSRWIPCEKITFHFANSDLSLSVTHNFLRSGNIMTSCSRTRSAQSGVWDCAAGKNPSYQQESIRTQKEWNAPPPTSETRAHSASARCECSVEAKWIQVVICFPTYFFLFLFFRLYCWLRGQRMTPWSTIVKHKELPLNEKYILLVQLHSLARRSVALCARCVCVCRDCSWSAYVRYAEEGALPFYSVASQFSLALLCFAFMLLCDGRAASSPKWVNNPFVSSLSANKQTFKRWLAWGLIISFACHLREAIMRRETRNFSYFMESQRSTAMTIISLFLNGLAKMPPLTIRCPSCTHRSEPGARQ